MINLDEKAATAQLITDILVVEVPKYMKDITLEITDEITIAITEDIKKLVVLDVKNIAPNAIFEYDPLAPYQFKLQQVSDATNGIYGYNITVKYNDNKSHISLSAFASTGG